ncbi:hypothetical protein EWM60_17630, partial [Candidatus Erwinia dacicola]|nr:hypothetical protein [Candidatus Erwinia dacicola]
MQGKHLTQKERFYIEKRRGEGVKPATIARELDLPRSTISRELRRNTDPAFNGVYSCRRADSLARERVINPCQKMLFTGWSHTFRTSSGRSFPPIPLLKSSVAACSWNSMSLSARIRFIAISNRSDRLAESCISNFLTGENATATVPRTSNEALFPTALALSIAHLKPTSNRNLAISR